MEEWRKGLRGTAEGRSERGKEVVGKRAYRGEGEDPPPQRNDNQDGICRGLGCKDVGKGGMRSSLRMKHTRSVTSMGWYWE